MFRLVPQLAGHTLYPPRATRDEHIQASTLDHLGVSSTPLVAPCGRPIFKHQLPHTSGSVVAVLNATGSQLAWSVAQFPHALGARKGERTRRWRRRRRICATSAPAAWKAGAGSSNSVSVSPSEMSRGTGSSMSVSVTGRLLLGVG